MADQSGIFKTGDISDSEISQCPRYLRIYWEATQNKSSNSSTVEVWFCVGGYDVDWGHSCRTQGYAYFRRNKGNSESIGGVSWNPDNRYQYAQPSISAIAHKTFTVNHDSKGRATVGFKITDGILYNSSNPGCYISRDWVDYDLNQIKRGILQIGNSQGSFDDYLQQIYDGNSFADYQPMIYNGSSWEEY